MHQDLSDSATTRYLRVHSLTHCHEVCERSSETRSRETKGSESHLFTISQEHLRMFLYPSRLLDVPSIFDTIFFSQLLSMSVLIMCMCFSRMIRIP